MPLSSKFNAILKYSHRNAHVDFLRGISILLVILSHFPQSGCKGPGSDPFILSQRFIDDLSANGSTGVYIFFVISGYLITSMSLRRYKDFGKIRLREFFVFRMSRILPTLLVLVAFNLFFYSIGKSGFEIPGDISIRRLLVSVFTFRFNLFYLNGGATLAAWAVLWSLAIEEVFYLVFPVISRIVRLRVLMCILFICVFAQGPFYRLANGWGSLYLYRGCFDCLALGCLVATIAQQQYWLDQASWLPRLLRFIGLSIIFAFYFAFNIHQNQIIWSWLPTIISFGAAIFLLGSRSVDRPKAGPSESEKLSPLVWIICIPGFLSYELYLFHIPLLLLLKSPLSHVRILNHGWLPVDLTFAVVMVFMTLLCGLLHIYFSEPVLHFTRRATEKLVKPRLFPF
jgi:peptidoglycan/LPS O-acetylase OafA/YrhL